MCLLIGPAGVGKTLLLKRLNACTGKGNFENLSEIPSTIATVGSNLVNVNIMKKHELTIRELGGSMGPIWHNYYADTNSVIYMIDVSNPLQVSSACIQLLTVLSNENLSSTPVLVVFNKVDMPTRMSRSEIELVFRLEEVTSNAPQKITIVETSAHTGEGLQEVVRWLQQCHK